MANLFVMARVYVSAGGHEERRAQAAGAHYAQGRHHHPHAERVSLLAVSEGLRVDVRPGYCSVGAGSRATTSNNSGTTQKIATSFSVSSWCLNWTNHVQVRLAQTLFWIVSVWFGRLYDFTRCDCRGTLNLSSTKASLTPPSFFSHVRPPPSTSL